MEKSVIQVNEQKGALYSEKCHALALRIYKKNWMPFFELWKISNFILQHSSIFGTEEYLKEDL